MRTSFAMCRISAADVSYVSLYSSLKDSFWGLRGPMYRIREQ